MHTAVNEPITVGVVYKSPKSPGFRGKRVKPEWFVWRGREYRIEEITYSWQERKGRELYHYFTVTDGANVYQLAYNAQTLDWILGGMYCEG